MRYQVPDAHAPKLDGTDVADVAQASMFKSAWFCTEESSVDVKPVKPSVVDKHTSQEPNDDPDATTHRRAGTDPAVRGFRRRAPDAAVDAARRTDAAEPDTPCGAVRVEVVDAVPAGPARR